jgi:hypothetical protein
MSNYNSYSDYDDISDRIKKLDIKIEYSILKQQAVLIKISSANKRVEFIKNNFNDSTNHLFDISERCLMITEKINLMDTIRQYKEQESFIVKAINDMKQERLGLIKHQTEILNSSNKNNTNIANNPITSMAVEVENPRQYGFAIPYTISNQDIISYVCMFTQLENIGKIESITYNIDKIMDEQFIYVPFDKTISMCIKFNNLNNNNKYILRVNKIPSNLNSRESIQLTIGSKSENEDIIISNTSNFIILNIKITSEILQENINNYWTINVLGYNINDEINDYTKVEFKKTFNLIGCNESVLFDKIKKSNK